MNTSAARAITRQFSSSSSSAAPLTAAASAARRKTERVKRIPRLKDLQTFQFDEPTSLGWMRLEAIKEAQDLARKVEANDKILRAQSKPFTPPTSPIRISSIIDLSDPFSPVHAKRVLLTPVAGLPFSTPEAMHRFKLLAGPRWSPGRPGAKEMDIEGNEGYNGGDQAIGREGWVKISEERFRNPRMNRKSASDILEKLVEAADVSHLSSRHCTDADRDWGIQDSNSPLSADIPIDMRHLLARQRKHHHRQGKNVWQRAEAMKARPDVGGVRGFPVEWLSEDMRGRFQKGDAGGV